MTNSPFVITHVLNLLELNLFSSFLHKIVTYCTMSIRAAASNYFGNRRIGQLFFMINLMTVKDAWNFIFSCKLRAT